MKREARRVLLQRLRWAARQPGMVVRLVGPEGEARPSDPNAAEDWLRTRSVVEENAALVDQVFGLGGRVPVACVANAHGKLNGEESAACLRALEACGFLFGRVEVGCHPHPAAPFILIGGPYSNRLVRPLQGLDPNDPGRRIAAPLTGQAWTFEFARDGAKRVVVYMNGRAIEEPCWPAVARTPEVAAKRLQTRSGASDASIGGRLLLQEDHLFVTRLDTRRSGSLILIEGSHASATMAFPYLLARSDLLAQLHSFTERHASSQGFQVAIEVGRIGYDHQRKQMKPDGNSLDIIEIASINGADDAAWQLMKRDPADTTRTRSLTTDQIHARRLWIERTTT